MSWVALGIKIASALGSLATAYSVSQIAPSVRDITGGVREALQPPPQTSTDAIHQAELQAQQHQTLSGTDQPQGGAVSGLPDQGGTSGKLIAALGALGIGAGVLGGVALARRTTRTRRTTRRRRGARRRGTMGFGRRRRGGRRRRYFGRFRRPRRRYRAY